MEAYRLIAYSWENHQVDFPLPHLIEGKMQRHQIKATHFRYDTDSASEVVQNRRGDPSKKHENCAGLLSYRGPCLVFGFPLDRSFSPQFEQYQPQIPANCYRTRQNYGKKNVSIYRRRLSMIEKLRTFFFHNYFFSIILSVTVCPSIRNLNAF